MSETFDSSAKFSSNGLKQSYAFSLFATVRSTGDQRAGLVDGANAHFGAGPSISFFFESYTI